MDPEEDRSEVVDVRGWLGQELSVDIKEETILVSHNLLREGCWLETLSPGLSTHIEDALPSPHRDGGQQSQPPSWRLSVGNTLEGVERPVPLEALYYTFYKLYK